MAATPFAFFRSSSFFRVRFSTKGKKLPPSKMGRPPKEKAVAWRANPRGIPYLYLASDPDTAIAEIRPDLYDLVTVGKFRSKELLEVIDLTKSSIGSPFSWGNNLKQVLNYRKFLRLLGDELSRPIDRKNAPLEYLPTRYLCELIKHLGYDGVLYKSHVANGVNVSLFDESKVKCTKTKQSRIDNNKNQPCTSEQSIVEEEGMFVTRCHVYKISQRNGPNSEYFLCLRKTGYIVVFLALFVR